MTTPKSTSWLEIDLGAVARNVAAARGLIGPDCGVLAIVKCDAYGHGAVEIARTVLDAGASGVCVANLNEARVLRRGGIEGMILLLNAAPINQARDVANLMITQALYSKESADALAAAALRVGHGVEAHLKVDTGMGRIGLTPDQALQLVTKLHEQIGSLGGFAPLTISGVFSHLATAEEADESYALAQFASFTAFLEKLREFLPDVKAHIANSAAALKYPQMRLDYVRLGLLIYGVPPSPDLADKLALAPVLTWKTRVAFVKKVEAGDSVSYGRTWKAPSPTTLITLPMGYGDGYSRALSNRAQVLFRGKLRPVVGTVCMNHVLVEVDDEPNVQVGEEVVLIGKQGDQRITAEQLADWAGTVPHEILARLGAHLDRFYKR
jgi:alanine racemase